MESGSVNGEAERSSRSLGLTVLAIGLSVGIVIGWHQPMAMVWPWFAGCGLLVVIAAVLRRGRAILVMALLCAAMASLGAGWVALRQNYVAPNDIAALLGDEPMLLRVQGVALGPPVLRARPAGSMSRFDYREPATYFSMRIDALVDAEDQTNAACGEVLVRVEGSVEPFRAGDRIGAIGFLMRPRAPRNPGEFNFRQYARSLGQAGLLVVGSRELVHVEHAESLDVAARFSNWRNTMRRRANEWLLADLPAMSLSQRDSLLANIMLGERDAQIDGVSDAFQRVGLAHILAISGFHMSVLAGFVLLGLRLIGGFHRWHGWLVIGVVLLYMMLIELHMPVLRSGVMTIAGCVGLICGRRLRVTNLVAMSAILLLLWRPDQLFNAGFQLTFGVVLALLHLSPPLRRRWFGDPDPSPSTSAKMLGEWLRTALVVSVVAWLVATPIAMCHFGVISPLAAPLSIVATPLSAVILAIGFVKMVFSAFLPGAAMIVGIPLSISSDLLLGLVLAIDGVPGSVWHVPQPSVAWTIAAVAWVCVWAIRAQPWRRKLLSFAALVLWFVVPILVSWYQAPALRVDMLAVGDGSCYVIRSGGSTIVFDAGSSSDLNIARHALIPALRRLGVGSIDAIVISHANLDHYSAVLDLIDEFGVDQALVTPQMKAVAEGDSQRATSFLLEELLKRDVPMAESVAGQMQKFGQASWEWLHPPAVGTFNRVNDSSMVIRIECGERSVLLCGDIMADAMESLMRNEIAIGADVLELPHHGSYHKVAERFIDRVNPKVVMQSAGWMRWRRDTWADRLQGRERLVTARDGACWVEIEEDGELRVGRFVRR